MLRQLALAVMLLVGFGFVAAAAPVMAAFSYTVPARQNAARGTFILSGGGEARAHRATPRTCACRAPRSALARRARQLP